MTREEQLIAMRGRDLIELCQKLGVKVHASKNSLKESKLGVVKRILKVEASESKVENGAIPFDGMDEVISEFEKITVKGDSTIRGEVAGIIKNIPKTYSDVMVEDIGSLSFIVTKVNNKCVIIPFVFGLAIIYGKNDCEYVELKEITNWIEQFCNG